MPGFGPRALGACARLQLTRILCCVQLRAHALDAAAEGHEAGAGVQLRLRYPEDAAAHWGCAVDVRRECPQCFLPLDDAGSGTWGAPALAPSAGPDCARCSAWGTDIVAFPCVHAFHAHCVPAGSEACPQCCEHSAIDWWR